MRASRSLLALLYIPGPRTYLNWALWQSFTKSKTDSIHQDKRIASIKGKTVGIVFAGTPHHGAEKAKWPLVETNLATVVLKDNSSSLLTALSRGSETLERLQNDFSKIAMSLRIKTFSENYRYPKIGKVCEKEGLGLDLRVLEPD
jgi:hypothetical protein